MLKLYKELDYDVVKIPKLPLRKCITFQIAGGFQNKSTKMSVSSTHVIAATAQSTSLCIF